MSTRLSYVPPTYEDLKQLETETKDTPESHILLVHIPAGFTREHIGAKVEYDYGRVRVFGERPLGDNRFSRFNYAYQVPATCDLNSIKGKVDGGIVNITMAKKVISREVPEEQKPTEQEAPKPPTQETEPEPEKDQEETPQKSTTEVEQEQATTADSDEVKAHEKGQEGISQDTKSTTESKEQVKETSTPPKATEESMPQEGQEGIPQKAAFSTDAKIQTEEKFAGPTAEDVEEKQKVEKKAPEEDAGKTSEAGKPLEEDVVDASTTEKESMEERKESGTDGKSSVPKATEKVNDTEIKGKFGGTAESKGKSRIMEMAASASQAVRKRFNEEDTQKLIYVGAAVLVVAIGVYATYKLRSSHRL